MRRIMPIFDEAKAIIEYLARGIEFAVALIIEIAAVEATLMRTVPRASARGGHPANGHNAVKERHRRLKLLPQARGRGHKVQIRCPKIGAPSRGLSAACALLPHAECIVARRRSVRRRGDLRAAGAPSDHGLRTGLDDLQIGRPLLASWRCRVCNGLSTAVVQRLFPATCFLSPGPFNTLFR